MREVLLAATLLLPLALPLTALAQSTQSPALSFVEPKDGATVRSPFRVKLAVVGMEVAKAGAVVPNSGHHVLIINGDAVPEGQPIPADPTHLHWGKGQTEQKIRLPAGQYKLTAQFANGAHQSYGPAVSQTITVTVK
ncbi:uncharacterized protein DUF4399 [Pseudoduganella flava]|uniref:DUF4399 domain-containing protein n=1 Tax=Pseudoduganella flava TaxID=871742 RepID=A0A562PZU4_9BURK|nr:DUF4399 domain-containing protein [Pseudoduganella flava]QGZ38714.1 DUF4399 domain-containing protein [Pseudoduganella flava]TWI49710.1 uncharacterized protein DUF4399 [Pseudoduganella flava]